MTTSTIAKKSSSSVLVRKTIEVRAPPERAFEVFTKEMGSWWPLASHHIGEVDAQTAVIEPFAGGRWFERGVDGTECDWGRVLAFEPPGRLVLIWQLDTGWKLDRALHTEVEVRFIADGPGTRVELEHRMLEAFGEKAESMQGIFDAEGGWISLLAAFVARASSN